MHLAHESPAIASETCPLLLSCRAAQTSSNQKWIPLPSS